MLNSKFLTLRHSAATNGGFSATQSSRLFTRRAAMRHAQTFARIERHDDAGALRQEQPFLSEPNQLVGAVPELVPADGIITSRLTELEVKNLAPVTERTLAPDATQSKEAAPEVLTANGFAVEAPAPNIEAVEAAPEVVTVSNSSTVNVVPAHVDQDVVIPLPAKSTKWGAELNEAAIQDEDAAPKIVPAKISVAAAPAPPTDESSVTPSTIDTGAPADPVPGTVPTEAAAIPSKSAPAGMFPHAPKMKQGKRAANDGLLGTGKSRSSRKEAGAEGASSLTLRDTMLRGYDFGGVNGTHSPPP